MSFIFDKLAPSPLNICFKRCFKSLLNPFQSIKQSQKSQKRGICLILHFGRHANGEAVAPPPSLALLLSERVTFSEKHYVRTNDFDDHKIGLVIHREYH